MQGKKSKDNSSGTQNLTWKYYAGRAISHAIYNAEYVIQIIIL